MRRWITIATLALPVAARAQPTVAPVAAQPTLPPIGARVRVVAEGILDGRRTATLLRRSGDTLTLSLRDEDPVAVPLARISSLETYMGTSRWHGARRGAFVVGMVGMSLHVLRARARENGERAKLVDGTWVTGSRITVEGLLRGLAFGVPLGAVVGSEWPTEIWTAVDLAPKLSIHSAPTGMVSAGLSFAIR